MLDAFPRRSREERPAQPLAAIAYQTTATMRLGHGDRFLGAQRMTSGAKQILRLNAMRSLFFGGASTASRWCHGDVIQGSCLWLPSHEFPRWLVVLTSLGFERGTRTLQRFSLHLRPSCSAGTSAFKNSKKFRCGCGRRIWKGASISFCVSLISLVSQNAHVLWHKDVVSIQICIISLYIMYYSLFAVNVRIF